MLADGEVTAPELLETYLERIARLDSELRCYRVVLSERRVTRPPRRKTAGRRRAATVLGVPIAIKDDVDVADEVTACGAPATGPR